MPLSARPEFKEIKYASPEYEETIKLRDQLLRKPLGLHFTAEQLAAEKDQWHLVAYQNGKLVACLVLVPKENADIKMRQVAVAESVQGSGIGSALVRFSEEFAIKKGFELMTLHARDTAVPFYLKLGYEKVGDLFYEVTIPHYAMQKHL